MNSVDVHYFTPTGVAPNNSFKTPLEDDSATGRALKMSQLSVNLGYDRSGALAPPYGTRENPYESSLFPKRIINKPLDNITTAPYPHRAGGYTPEYLQSGYAPNQSRFPSSYNPSLNFTYHPIPNTQPVSSREEIRPQSDFMSPYLPYAPSTSGTYGSLDYLPRQLSAPLPYTPSTITTTTSSYPVLTMAAIDQMCDAFFALPSPKVSDSTLSGANCG